MKQDPEYLRKLLDTLQACPSPWPSLAYLDQSGIPPSAEMLFHLQLLRDDGFVEPIDCGNDFGFSPPSVIENEFYWRDANLRLTAKGHEFIEALDQKEVWDVIKEQFKSASLKTIFQVGRALIDGLARESISKHCGAIRL